MEILLIMMVFFIGTVFGSFFTLAVYRIPLGKDITHERSFCPKCEHTLGFKDLIPVWSYLLLRGKCRYCGNKVRPRYFILEILSGLVFVLAYMSLKINSIGIAYLYLGVNFESTLEKLVILLAFIFFYITNAIIVGIDQEYKQINKKVLTFGCIMQMLYMAYLYILVNRNWVVFGTYIVAIFILIVGIQVFNKTKNYLFQNIVYFAYIISFIRLENVKLLLPIFLIVCSIRYMVKNRLQTGMKKEEKNQLPMGFCLGIAGIITALFVNYGAY